MKKAFTGKDDNQNFLITVRSKENHTWQGTVQWIEGGEQQHFRSVLELLKLMDSAVGDEVESEED